MRVTDTNAGDDSEGEVFGLPGNLYLVPVFAFMASLGLYILLVALFSAPVLVGLIFAFPPFVVVMLWLIFLKKNKPKGYDIDYIEYLFLGGGFTYVAGQQDIHPKLLEDEEEQ